MNFLQVTNLFCEMIKQKVLLIEYKKERLKVEKLLTNNRLYIVGQTRYGKTYLSEEIAKQLSLKYRIYRFTSRRFTLSNKSNVMDSERWEEIKVKNANELLVKLKLIKEQEFNSQPCLIIFDEIEYLLGIDTTEETKGDFWGLIREFSAFEFLIFIDQRIPLQSPIYKTCDRIYGSLDYVAIAEGLSKLEKFTDRKKHKKYSEWLKVITLFPRRNEKYRYWLLDRRGQPLTKIILVNSNRLVPLARFLPMKILKKEGNFMNNGFAAEEMIKRAISQERKIKSFKIPSSDALIEIARSSEIGLRRLALAQPYLLEEYGIDYRNKVTNQLTRSLNWLQVPPIEILDRVFGIDLIINVCGYGIAIDATANPESVIHKINKLALLSPMWKRLHIDRACVCLIVKPHPTNVWQALKSVIKQREVGAIEM